MERDGEEYYLLLIRTLLNQFVINVCAKIETDRFSWIHNDQKKMKSEDYVHLEDAVSRADGQLSKLVVLASAFIGRPRYMHERNQDVIIHVQQI